MSSAIDQIVDIKITKGTATVAVASFTLPIVLAAFAAGHTTKAFTRARAYASVADLSADGWATSDPVYMAVAAMLAQPSTVKKVYVGRRDTDDADWATALNAIQGENDEWYGVALVPSGSTVADVSTELEQVASWIEGQKKISLLESNDPGIIDGTSTTDVASVLKGFKYTRTALLYRGAAKAGEYAAAAWIGRVMGGWDVGAATYAYKTLSGCSTDALLVSKKDIVHGKNANTYCTVSGVDVTEEGKVASGEFIDVTIGLDWVEANIQAAVFGALVALGKLPYDDSGIQAVGSIVRGVLVQAAGMGILQLDSIQVTVPRYADIPVADRTARRLPDVKFTALLQGAIQTVQIRGTVSV